VREGAASAGRSTCKTAPCRQRAPKSSRYVSDVVYCFRQDFAHDLVVSDDGRLWRPPHRSDGRAAHHLLVDPDVVGTDVGPLKTECSQHRSRGKILPAVGSWVGLSVIGTPLNHQWGLRVLRAMAIENPHSAHKPLRCIEAAASEGAGVQQGQRLWKRRQISPRRSSSAVTWTRTSAIRRGLARI